MRSRRPKQANPRRGSAPLLLDVTRPLGKTTAVFPGDPRVELTPVADPGQGDRVRVTRLVMSAHAGTHLDAPRHLGGLEEGVEQVPLASLLGPALVLDMKGRSLTPADVARLPRTAPPRILLRSAGAVAPAAARALVRRGVLLLGTDALSIDREEDEGLPAHAVLLGAGVAVLECLDLSRAPAGRYELIALPLLIPGCDGAPARVVLRRPKK